MRLTPSGQQGGDGGHSHGHLQNWGREDVSSSGTGVKAMAVGAGEEACGGTAEIKGCQAGVSKPKGRQSLSHLPGVKRFT